MARFDLDFKGFLDMAEDLDEIDGALKEATENALLATFNYLQPLIEAYLPKAWVVNERRSKSHNINWQRTGQTKSKLAKENTVEWEGTTASIGVGFVDTPVPIILALGTPYMSGDSTFYRLLKGKGGYATKIGMFQKSEFEKVIKKYFGDGYGS